MLRLLPSKSGVLLPSFTLPGSFVGAITASFFSIFAAAALGVLAPRVSVAYDALDDAPDSLDVVPLFFAREEYVG